MTNQASNTALADQSVRKLLRCRSNIILNDKQSEVRTRDISLYDIEVISEANEMKRATGWLQLPIPINNEQDELFEVKITVLRSVYSGEHQGFKLLLDFIDPTETFILQLKRYLNS